MFSLDLGNCREQYLHHRSPGLLVVGRPERLHRARKHFVVSTLYFEADRPVGGVHLKRRRHLRLIIAATSHPASSRRAAVAGRCRRWQTIFSLYQNLKWACTTAVSLCSNALISLEPVAAVSPHMRSWSRCRILEPLSGHCRSR